MRESQSFHLDNDRRGCGAEGQINVRWKRTRADLRGRSFPAYDADFRIEREHIQQHAARGSVARRPLVERELPDGGTGCSELHDDFSQS